jgi:hypothetical protein
LDVEPDPTEELAPALGSGSEFAAFGGTGRLMSRLAFWSSILPVFSQALVRSAAETARSVGSLRKIVLLGMSLP